MSYVIAAPEMMTSAAADLGSIGANVRAAHMVAAAPTVAVVPAAADEVSAAIASVFANHAQAFQGLAGKAAAFNDQFVQHLSAGAFSYASIEATIARFLQNLPARADELVSILASTPPQQLLEDLGLVLTSPVWLPVVGIGVVIFVLYLRYAINNGLISPSLFFF